MYAARYVNRDLSWLEFNRRVLEEAQDVETPLLERLKFVAIVSSNLDEFMSVRVAGLMDQIKHGYTKKDFSGLTPTALLKRIMARARRSLHEQYRTHRELLRQLGKEGIYFTTYEELTATQQEAMNQYFHDIVFPVLTPMAVDQSRPFPLIHTKELYLSVVLKEQREDSIEDALFALLQVPSILPRYIQVPNRQHSKKREFILLEDLIKIHIDKLFSGYYLEAVHAFRLIRNSDLSLNEDDAEDLLEEIEKELHRRRRGVPVRLEIEDGMHPYALELLQEEFDHLEHVYTIEGPIDLSFYLKFASSLPGYDHLRYPKLEITYPAELCQDDEDIFQVLRNKDVLLYHPYQSFDAVHDFISQAADDPDVLAIKMTLYRVSGNSVLIRALKSAAAAGKQVTVVVELKARFDEERNIAWARELEQAGCHVVYGLVGLKTHAKITLIVRREQSILRRYVHVGTGNYNENTATLYTDVGLFTSHPIIGEDASLLFNEVTGFSAPRDWQAFGVAPTELKDKLSTMIEREIAWAERGEQAYIIAQMNSLSNQEIIDQLYAASQQGVRIDLIVRGVCCLRPGVPGLSENIRVISIVDRFLEHARIFYFRNGGTEEVYLSSADWMTRNLTRRIELMCPVLEPSNQQALISMLNLKLRDNVKARELQNNGLYTRVEAAGAAHRSQFEAMELHRWKSECTIM